MVEISAVRDYEPYEYIIRAFRNVKQGKMSKKELYSGLGLDKHRYNQMREEFVRTYNINPSEIYTKKELEKITF